MKAIGVAIKHIIHLIVLACFIRMGVIIYDLYITSVEINDLTKYSNNSNYNNITVKNRDFNFDITVSELAILKNNNNEYKLINIIEYNNKYVVGIDKQNLDSYSNLDFDVAKELDSLSIPLFFIIFKKEELETNIINLYSDLTIIQSINKDIENLSKQSNKYDNFIVIDKKYSTEIYRIISNINNLNSNNYRYKNNITKYIWYNVLLYLIIIIYIEISILNYNGLKEKQLHQMLLKKGSEED